MKPVIYLTDVLTTLTKRHNIRKIYDAQNTKNPFQQTCVLSKFQASPSTSLSHEATYQLSSKHIHK